MAKPITLKPKKRKWASVGEQLRKIETLPLPLKILASPETTGLLLTTLGTLVGARSGLSGAVGKGLKQTLTGVGLGVGVPRVAGIVKTSPKAEKFIKDFFLKPMESGEKIGRFIEEPFKGVQSKKERIKDVLTGAGIGIGTATGVSLIPKIKDIVTKTKKGAGEVLTIPSSVPTPKSVLTAPSVPTPLGAKEKEKEKEIVPKPTTTPQFPMEKRRNINIKVTPNIKLTNKNYINNVLQTI